MPRIGRTVVPHYPHHIVQRGHNRQVVFAADDDFRYYLDTLAEFKMVFGVKVYAFCLMTNHIHLLLAPETQDGISKLMKRLAGRQTRYRNKLEARSGTLWESRYKSSIVDADDYLLACKRYIELNPVRAAMVVDPLEYAWSSVHHCIDSGCFPWLDAVPRLEQIGSNCYLQFLQTAIPEGERQLIRDAVQRGQLTGGSRFVDEIERITGLRVEHSPCPHSGGYSLKAIGDHFGLHYSRVSRIVKRHMEAKGKT